MIMTKKSNFYVNEKWKQLGEIGVCYQGKWATCHKKQAFTLEMQSTQLSESLNSHFKAWMRLDVNVIQFFKHCKRLVEEKCYNELICEYKSQHKPKLRYDRLPILMQLTQVYAPTIFNLFHDDFALFLTASKWERKVSQLPFECISPCSLRK